MKIIATILAVLTLTSTIFSFGDAFITNSNEFISESLLDEGAAIHESHHQDTTEHKEHHDDEEHSKDAGCEDECHFCICSCTVHNIVFPVFQLSPLNLENLNSKINTNTTFLYVNSYLDRIFQPPQV